MNTHISYHERLLQRRHAKFQSLLPWQAYVLAAMAGLFAVQYMAPALTVLCLLLLVVKGDEVLSRWRFCWPSPWKGLGAGLVRIMPLVLAFALAFGYGYMALCSQLERGTESTSWITGKKQRVTGYIASVEGLPDQRLRIILENVQPVDLLGVDEENSVSQSQNQSVHVVWTWEEPDFESIHYELKESDTQSKVPSPSFRPMVGQYIEATLAIKSVDALANPNSFDLEQFWAMKGVRHRAWTTEAMPELTIISEARKDALWRERLRLRIDERIHILVAHGFMGIGRSQTERAPHEAGKLGHEVATSNTQASLTMSAATVVMGILFGDRYYMDSSLLDYFARTDLLHTLALSGQHLIIAGLIAGLCVFFIRRNSHDLLNKIPTKKLFFLCSLPCAGLYLWLGNAPPSLVRASTMLAFWAIFFCLSYRPVNILDILLCALCCILLISPLSIFDLGLQLSSLAVASLSASWLLSRHCMRLMGIPLPAPLFPPNGPPHGIDLPSTRRLVVYVVHRMAFAMLLIGFTSALIQITLVPIQLMVFGIASPWFFLNMIWMPITDLLVLPLSFLGMACHAGPDTDLPPLSAILFMMHILGDFAFWLAIQLSLGITTLLQYLHDAGLLDFPAFWRPHWTTAIGYGGILLCLLYHLGRPRLPMSMRRLALASCLLFATGFALMAKDAYNPRLQMTIFDVGMGQAVYIRTPDNSKIMIDGGGFMSKRFDTGRDIVARALTDNQWPRLDMVFNTHPDNDHLRGLIHLVQAFPVHYYGYNGDDETKNLKVALDKALGSAGLTPQALQAGMVIDLGSHLSLEVLHPQSAQYGASNHASLVMRLVHTAPHSQAKGLAMLCGDVDTKGLQDILRYAKTHNKDLSAEVLVLPHHGSKSALLPAFYDAVQPRMAMASCAKNHRYNYPNPEIKEALAQRNIPLLSTGLCGALHITWDNLTEEGDIQWERQK